MPTKWWVVNAPPPPGPFPPFSAILLKTLQGRSVWYNQIALEIFVDTDSYAERYGQGKRNRGNEEEMTHDRLLNDDGMIIAITFQRTVAR